MLAQIKAERANPKGDIWWAGPGDAYLQAPKRASSKPTCRRTSKTCRIGRSASPWFRSQVSGVYGGILSLGYNTELQAKKKLPVPKCWKDLLEPAYKNEVMLGNPNSSGGISDAGIARAGVGEDEAFKYMKALNANVSSYARSGIGPMTAVKQGEIYVGSTVLHGVINEIVAGFPVKPVLPCEGVGYEIGSMAIVKGARNLDNAKRFVDWALTVEAQKIGLDVRNTPSRPTRTCRCRRRCRTSPSSRSSTTTSRSTVRARPASGSSSAGRRRSAKRRDDGYAPRGALLARHRCGRVPVRSWYALQGSVFALAWIPQFATKEAAPALLQVFMHARGWLAPVGLVLALGAVFAVTSLPRDARAAALIALGATGFIYLFVQGFAIGPSGWYFDSLAAALPALSRGQFGMGLGAALVATSFGMLFSLGLAGRGYFKATRSSPAACSRSRSWSASSRFSRSCGS
jgi:ABC-type Fe3+ transport system substrate-binding protein